MALAIMLTLFITIALTACFDGSTPTLQTTLGNSNPTQADDNDLTPDGISNAEVTSQDRKRDFSEDEIRETLDNYTGKTAFEAMESLRETGFTFICLNDGRELSDFDPKVFYVNSYGLNYSKKEIRLVLLPIDIYGYTGYEEKFGVIGDIVEFGSYVHDPNHSNGKEEIKWIVLDAEGSHYLLCSLYILDSQRYNDANVATAATWESSSLRFWLNNTFIDEAFTQEQQAGIFLTSVENDGGITQDKIFLLSYDEAWHYFSNESLRQAAGTPYAISARLFVSNNTGMSSWWLRTPASPLYKFVVNPSGIHDNSPRVNERAGIRPALWVGFDILNNNP